MPLLLRYTIPPTMIVARSPLTSGMRPASSPLRNRQTIAVLRLPRNLRTLDPAADPPPRFRKVPQRVSHQPSERVRVRERLRGQLAVLDPAAERVLPGPELTIDQLRQRDP